MRTVNEVSKLTGVSIRTLQYYDSIGLLKPTEYTEVGYRLYDEEALERLQQILLFRELEFPLKEIKDIIYSKSPALWLGFSHTPPLFLLTQTHIAAGLGPRKSPGRKTGAFARISCPNLPFRI